MKRQPQQRRPRQPRKRLANRGTRGRACPVMGAGAAGSRRQIWKRVMRFRWWGRQWHVHFATLPPLPSSTEVDGSEAKAATPLVPGSTARVTVRQSFRRGGSRTDEYKGPKHLTSLRRARSPGLSAGGRPPPPARGRGCRVFRCRRPIVASSTRSQAGNTRFSAHYRLGSPGTVNRRRDGAGRGD